MATLSTVHAQCPSCRTVVQACIVGTGRRLPCPNCGEPVLVKESPVADHAGRPLGLDAHLPASAVARRQPSFPWLAAMIAVGCAVGLGWWLVAGKGMPLDASSWKAFAVAAGALLVLAVLFVVSWRAAVMVLKITVPLCCVGLVAWKLLGPSGLLDEGPLRLLATAPGGQSRTAAGAPPPDLLKLLAEVQTPGGSVALAAPTALPATLPPKVADGASPVTFILEGAAGIDVGASVRRAFSEMGPGGSPSWSMSTRGASVSVTLWMGGDFDRIAKVLPLGREKSRDEATRRIVIELDPARCIRRR
jgi:predicted RNA-binding Zn-ribbon protein involved in translation (DUF1610 family)